jgi:HAD superfamily hydrolase (TIGR01493 family)
LIDQVSGVLVDFVGTLFERESPLRTLARMEVTDAERDDLLAAVSTVRALDLDSAELPAGVPAHLTGHWQRRDLGADDHRATYAGLLHHAGMPATSADRFYELANTVQAWVPYDDTVTAMHAIKDRGLPIALVSNIGFDLRPIFEANGLLELIDAFVLSYEIGAMKPDPVIFETACTAIGVEPVDVVMIGDSERADGGATAIGARFAPVGSPRGAGALLRALGL